MQFAITLLKNAEKLTTKHLVLSGVFVCALAASIGLGLATKGHSSAAIQRDCSTNSIDYAPFPAAGQCGAADAAELVADARNNVPNDLQTIYSHFGLAPASYDKFAAEAKQGTLFRDGRLEVNGQTVATSAWTMGRQSFGNPNREAIAIGGKTYYHSATQHAFGPNTNSLPVMVWFDANGVVIVAIVNACGNPVSKMNKVVPKADCTALVKTQPDAVKKPNTYRFSAGATFAGNASLSRVVYTFSDDNTTVTKTSLTDEVEHTFTKDGEVTVTIFAKVPGGGEMPSAPVTFCKMAIKYVPPMFVCVNLVPATINEQQRSFRFTVKTKMDVNTTLKGVDFTVDGKTDTNIITKDNEGNIYKDYTFQDDQTHTIKAIVYFTTSEGVKSANCEASVTPKKTPMCTVPGKEHLPANHPDCGYCKPGVPFGSEACKQVFQPQVLAATGPNENLMGLAAATGVAGFAAHKLYLRRKFGQR